MIHHKSNQEVYEDFLKFVSSHSQINRAVMNRKMFSVFIWCFATPAITSITVLILVKFGILPVATKQYIEWLVLAFPVAYASLIMGSEIINGLPNLFRYGGLSTTLKQIRKDFDWRTETVEELKQKLQARPDQWKWLAVNFEIDLASLRSRTRFMTIFGGIAFFLVFSGIDHMGTEPVLPDQPSVEYLWILIATTVDGVFQVFAFILFLILLHLSGSQVIQALEKYLSCLESLSMSESVTSETSRSRTAG